MADNKSKRGGGDRKCVISGQGYEVIYVVRKQGLQADEAREIIKRAGNDCEKLNAEAEKRKER